MQSRSDAGLDFSGAFISSKYPVVRATEHAICNVGSNDPQLRGFGPNGEMDPIFMTTLLGGQRPM